MAACREKGDDELPSVPSGNDTTEADKDNAQIKEIDLFSGNNGYVIEAGASQKFVFAPEYSGEYTFETDHSASLKVSYGAETSDITGVFSKEISAGERFEFEARNEGNETVTGNVAVDVAEVSDNKAVFNADVNESRILKFAPEESAMYDIKCSAGLLVSDVRLADSTGELVRIDMCGETEKIFPIEIVGSDLTGLVIDNDTGLVTIGAEREAGDSFTLGGTANDGTVYSYTLTVIPI